MEIIEQFIAAKNGKLEECEDLIVFSDYFAAVIDGATSRDMTMYDGKKTGLVAALLVKDVFENLPEKATLEDVIHLLEQSFYRFYCSNEIDSRDNSRILTASAVLYSSFHHQVWMFGDCQCMFGHTVYNNPNGIDEIVASVRSFINQAELLNGKTLDWIRKNDPGAAYINDLLISQFNFQNQTFFRDGAFGYLAIDGRKMQIDKVKVLDIPQQDQELILASDGYPVLAETLLLCEKALTQCLTDDPLCIYSNKCVKCLKNDQVSYDDRAYLRISIA